MAGSAMRGSGSNQARPLDDRSRATVGRRRAGQRTATRQHDGALRERGTAPDGVAPASQLGGAEPGRAYTRGPQIPPTASRPEGVPNARRAGRPRAVRQGGIAIRFAMLGSMAYVLAEIPATGSAGTSLDAPCTQPHWGFVIEGELTVRDRPAPARRSRPAARSTCPPAARSIASRRPGRPHRRLPAGRSAARSERRARSSRRGSSVVETGRRRPSCRRSPLRRGPGRPDPEPSRGRCPRTS